MIKSELVDKAVNQIKKRVSNYEYFFERLDSADWIQPLFERGFFRKPPGSQRHGDYISFPAWPDSKYLARMARVPEAQEKILDICLEVPDVDNPRVLEIRFVNGVAGRPRVGKLRSDFKELGKASNAVDDSNVLGGRAVLGRRLRIH